MTHEWTGPNRLRANHVQQNSSDPSRGGKIAPSASPREITGRRADATRGDGSVVGREAAAELLDGRAMALGGQATLIGPGGRRRGDAGPRPRQRGGHQTTHLFAGVFQVARLIARDLAPDDRPPPR